MGLRFRNGTGKVSPGPAASLEFFGGSGYNCAHLCKAYKNTRFPHRGTFGADMRPRMPGVARIRALYVKETVSEMGDPPGGMPPPAFALPRRTGDSLMRMKSIYSAFAAALV